MAAPLRVSTFNVENLFTRAKVLNFADNAVGDGELAKVNRLRKELRKTAYDAPTIVSLYQQLKDYIEIVEVRGKLFKGQTKTALSAKSVKDWGGYISFKRDKFSDEARTNTAKVLRNVNADIQCFIEVENRPTLKHFCIDRLPKSGSYSPFRHHMLIDGNDNRGIDVALGSRFPVRTIWSHVDDSDDGGKTQIFSRDCLEVEIDHPTGPIFLLLNHLKSKGFGAQATNDARRLQQSKRLAQVLGRYNLTKDRVIVLGDLNDTPGSSPLAPLFNVSGLHDVLTQLPANDRWTYHYTKNEQIDYILVSDPLKAALTGAGVERRGMFGVDKYTNGATKPFPSVTKKTDAASDHGAVWADFTLT